MSAVEPLVTVNRNSGQGIAAGDLTRAHLDREILVETAAAVYFGHLASVSHYPTRVYATVIRNGAEAKLTLDLKEIVFVSTAIRA